MKLDVQLDARPDAAVDRARHLLDAGVDGLFTNVPDRMRRLVGD